MEDGEGGGTRFRDWFACPECDSREGVSSLAHGTTIVLECYNCGRTGEYVIGKDVSLQNLDIGAIQQIAENARDPA